MSSEIIVDFDKIDEEELWNHIFTYLKNNDEGNEPKIYFSGECDSNQTEFETKSNYLQIGVLAHNDNVGLILLRLLRCVIDGHDIHFVVEDVYNEVDGKNVSLEKFMEILAKQENMYMSSHSLGDRFVNILHGWKGETRITKRITEVDVWTLPRIENDLH